MAKLQPPLLDDSFPLDLTAPFTRAMAHAAGIGDKRLAILARDGFVRRPIRGVYVATQVPDSLALRVAMLKLVVPDDCFVTDRTAGWLHGCPMILAPNDHLVVPPVSMFRPADAGRLRNRLSRSGERTLSDHDLMEIDGLVVTTPLRTALDLGRLESRKHALGCLDQLLSLNAFSRDELLAELPRFKGARGVVQLRQLAPLADGRAQSPGESALRLDWLDAGLPSPEPQLPIVHLGIPIYYLDLALPELLFAAEYDGEEWHTSPEDREHDEVRRRWITEERSFLIKVFRKEHVFGRSPDACFELAAAFREARATLGTRRRRWL